MNKCLVLIAVAASIFPVPAAGQPGLPVDVDVHEKCVEARDYSGCAKAFLDPTPTRQRQAFLESDYAGKKLLDFEGLQGDSKCNVVLYENAADFCGTYLGRKSVLSWSSYQVRALMDICIKDADITFEYLSSSGREATSISFINQRSAKKFDNAFLLWSKMLPERIVGNC